MKKDSNMAAVDFTGLILGFSSAALYYIGHSTIEGKGIPEKNLPLALQNIEILKLLKDKTKGNLTAQESEMLEHVLQDLGQKYNAAAR